MKEFDLLDEMKLNIDQVKNLCCNLFDKNIHVNADENFSEFLKILKRNVDDENLVFDPVQKKMSKWININHIDSLYNKERCNCVIA
jgi:hypothetical protein